MNELTKIAVSNDTYLVKCAGIAALFASGEVTAANADAAAIEMGVSPDDVAEVYTHNYGDMTKMASDAGEMTYLQKTAEVADMIASGTISSPAEITKIAMAHNLDVDDVESIYNLAYSDDYGLDKTAELNEANSILADRSATYLQKTATIAAAYADGVVSSEDATAAAHHVGISVDDVNALLGKQAADEKVVTDPADKKKLWESTKELSGKAKAGFLASMQKIKNNPIATGVGVGLSAGAGAGATYALGRKKEVGS